MRRYLPLIVVLLTVLVPLYSASFPPVQARTIGGSSFNFPSDALAEGPALFAIAMGSSRENGELQQQHLLAWQKYIEASTSSLRSWPIYHLPVIEAPGFVHALIRRGIAKSYEALVDPSRAAVIFVKDTPRFAAAAGIPLDDRATIAVVLQDGRIAGFVKGLPTDETLGSLEIFANRY